MALCGRRGKAIEHGPENDAEQARDEDRAGAYWRANIRLLLWLMAIWFLASFGAGILFRPFLDQFWIGGYPLGFWFAQQGSIYVFIALIAFYSWRIHRIEQQYEVDDDDHQAGGAA